MVHLPPLQRLLLVLPMFAVACTTTGWEGARARVDELSARVEQVQVEAEVTRSRTADALAQLRTLTASDSGTQDVVAAYARLVKSIDAAEQQASRFREAIVPMKAAAMRVFEQWERDAAGIANEDLARRGQTRLQQSRERFEAILTAADAAEVTLTNFHRSLRDHTLFLGHDLNSDSLRVIRAELLSVATTEKAASTQLKTCVKSARTYVSTATPPTAAAAGTAAMPPAAPARTGR